MDAQQQHAQNIVMRLGVPHRGCDQAQHHDRGEPMERNAEPSNDVRLSASITQSAFDEEQESTAAISWLFEPAIGPSPFGNVIGNGRVEARGP